MLTRKKYKQQEISKDADVIKRSIIRKRIFRKIEKKNKKKKGLYSSE